MPADSQTLSRYEINRAVNSLLTRHDIDLSLLNVSSSTTLVHLGGVLMKGTGGDLRPTDIDLIFTEIRRIRQVRGIVADLENWIITNIDGGWQAIPVKQASRTTGAFSGPPQEHHIDTEEAIEDVLQDIKDQEQDES